MWKNRNWEKVKEYLEKSYQGGTRREVEQETIYDYL